MRAGGDSVVDLAYHIRYFATSSSWVSTTVWIIMYRRTVVAVVDVVIFGFDGGCRATCSGSTLAVVPVVVIDMPSSMSSLLQLDVVHISRGVIPDEDEYEYEEVAPGCCAHTLSS